MKLIIILRVHLESLFTAYLILSFHINTFDKNYRCLKKLIKITYGLYNPILSYFNKFHGEVYKKILYISLKINHLNDKTIIMTNYVKIMKK